MRARDIMRRELVTVGPDLPLDQVAQMLAANRISAVPVVDDDARLIGMLAVENMVRPEDGGRRRPWRQVLADPSLLLPHRTRVGEVMSRDVVTVDEATPLRTLIHLMAKRPIKRLPVVRDDRLTGIVSRVDLLRALSHGLS